MGEAGMGEAGMGEAGMGEAGIEVSAFVLLDGRVRVWSFKHKKFTICLGYRFCLHSMGGDCLQCMRVAMYSAIVVVFKEGLGSKGWGL